MEKISFQLFKNYYLLNILVLGLIITLLVYLFHKYTNFKTKNLSKLDISLILLLTSLFALVSLYRLGNPRFFKSIWQPTSQHQEIIFKLESPEIDKIYAVNANGDNNSNPDNLQVGSNNIIIYGSNDLVNWVQISDLEKGSIFQYNIKNVTSNYTYIKLSNNNINNALYEIGFKIKDQDLLSKVEIYQDIYTESSYPASLLIDEQDIIVLNPTYYDQGYFDEIYHPRNAWEIANGQVMYASVHPLLGTSIIALFIKIFGFSPFSFRIGGALFSIMMVPLLYLIGKLLFKKTYPALFTSLLFSVDFMHYTTGRIGTLEPFSVFFILLMYYFMFKYRDLSLNESPIKSQFTYLFLSGLSMGLAWATKWTGLYASIGLALVFFIKVFELKDKKKLLKTLSACLIFFVLVPLVIYCVSFMWCKIYRNQPMNLANIIRHNMYMFEYHANLEATHPFQSVWYQWLLNIRPIWYYFNKNAAGMISSISCFSNPAISYVGLASLFYTFYRSFKKDKTALLISICFLSSFVPWMKIDRSLFAYHFFPSTPFMLLAMGYAFANLKTSKKYTNIYLALCFLTFILFLPVISGFYTTPSYIESITWFKTWYFGS